MYSFVLNLNFEVTPWHVGYSKDSHLLTREQGGTEFYELLQGTGGNYTAGGNYMINPDYTWHSNGYPAVGDALFTEKGIFPHDCSTEAKHHVKAKHFDITKVCYKNNSLIIDATSEGFYSVIIFSAKGQKMRNIQKRLLKTGTNNITLGSNSLSQGVYFVEIHSGDRTVTKEIVVR